MTSRRAFRAACAGCALTALAGFTNGCQDAPTAPEEALERSSPAEVGMNQATLDTLVQGLARGDFGNVRSLLVVRHGKLVLEGYYRGASATTLEPVYSITKSVTSLLFGTPEAQAAALDTASPVRALLPEYAAQLLADTLKKMITLGHLFTMTAGFEWDEWATNYGHPDNPTSALAVSGDWVRYTVERPIAHPPGRHFTYNSGCSVVLGAVLDRHVAPVPELARTAVFDRIGIGEVEWEAAARGLTNTGWGLSLRPRDLATLGLLVLRRGRWADVTVLASDWIHLATASHVQLNNGWGYGYQWWTRTVPPSAETGPIPFTMELAWGWGDQFLFVVPAFDLVVASTAANFDGPLQDQALQFVPRYIVAAVLRGTSDVR